MKLLETTLRDGSYSINFQFTASDTAIIGKQLESAGFELIEIGHGVGLGASEKGMGKAAETDEAYLQAAAESIKRAKFGMFCIPGIASLDHVDLCAQYHMGFIRVGVNVTEVEKAKTFIARAKKHGMYVSTNLMKSYALEPKEFAKKAVLVKEYGADVLSIVDSAGGMLPGELDRYAQAIRDVSDIPLAFHGHDNLGLAVAHSLRAVELGFEIVDTSLQGMGRSSGNASTELVVAALKRLGKVSEIDFLKVLDIGQKYIRPLIRRRGVGSLDIVAGYSQFHSSYMGLLRQYSSKYHIDPRKLMIRVTDTDKVNGEPALFERSAKTIQAESDEVFTARFEFDEYFGEEQVNSK